MTYSTVSSHFLHIQRTALMYNGGMLIGMCIELVVRVHTACHVSCIALVILDKLLKRECLTGISLDALHDALAAVAAAVMSWNLTVRSRSAGMTISRLRARCTM